MKHDDIINSFDKAKPDQYAVNRMYNGILENADSKSFKKTSVVRKVVPAAAMAVVVAFGVLAYSALSGKAPSVTETANDGSKAVTDDLAPGDFAGETANDMVAQVDMFTVGDIQYYALSQEQRDAFGFPEAVVQKDIGDRIGKISSTDGKINGLEYFEYLPAGCRAVVAVKDDKGYTLYKFYNFESYIKNKDEDAKAYLELFGINGYADISKVRFINMSMDVISEITDTAGLKKFYEFYSVMKDSSDEYFEKLYSYRKEITGETGGQNRPEDQYKPEDRNPPDNIVYDEIPPDYKADNYPTPSTAEIAPAEDPARDLAADGGGQLRSGAGYDYGQTGADPGKGGADDLFGNAVTIRIYNKNGVYMDAPYYRNFGFISRHKVTQEFADFLKGYLY